MDKFYTFEGSLWRCGPGAFNLSGNVLLRDDYSKHHRNIENGLQLRSSLRAGPYAWPGGYDVLYITDDGACLCSACVKDELMNVLWAIRNECSDGWRVVGSFLSDSVDEEHCDHCGKIFGVMAA